MFPLISLYQWNQRLKVQKNSKAKDGRRFSGGMKVHDVYMGFRDNYTLREAIQLGLELPDQVGCGIVVGTEELFYRNYDIYTGTQAMKCSNL